MTVGLSMLDRQGSGKVSRVNISPKYALKLEAITADDNGLSCGSTVGSLAPLGVGLIIDQNFLGFSVSTFF